MFNAVERAASGGGWEKPRTEGYCISVNAAQVELLACCLFGSQRDRGIVLKQSWLTLVDISVLFLNSDICMRFLYIL